MQYKKKINKHLTELFEVSYDSKKLYEVLDELKKLKYKKVYKTTMPVLSLSERLYKSIKKYIYDQYKHVDNISIIKNSIVINDNICSYCYSKNVYPQLYNYLDYFLEVGDISYLDKIIEYHNSEELIPYEVRENIDDIVLYEMELNKNNYYFNELTRLYYYTLSLFNIKYNGSYISISGKDSANINTLLKTKKLK